MQFCNITHMDHVGKTEPGHFHWKGFDLTGPEGLDPVSGCRQREAADSIEQAAEG